MELLHRNCPVCNIEFEHIAVDNETIEVCSKCHGMFFEYDEMSTGLQALPGETFTEIMYGDGSPERKENLICPKCGETMQQCEYALSKIHIDRCNNCTSIFLDAGEQHTMQQYLASMESPDVARIQEEKEEEQFQDDFRKIARQFLDIALKKIGDR